MSRTFSTSRIQREVIQANGQRGSNQKSACDVVISCAKRLRRWRRDIPVGRDQPNRDRHPARRLRSWSARVTMMPAMPGTNLTRDEAADPRRAPRRHVVHHRPRPHDRRRRPSARPPRSRSRCTEPGAETFADLVGATVHEITLNGELDRPGDGVRRQPDRARPTWPAEQRARRPGRLHLLAAPARACTASSTRSTTGSTSTRSSRCPTPAACSPPSSSPTSRRRSPST